MNKQSIRYYKAVEKHLRCGILTRKTLLSQFRSSLSSYLADYPNAEYVHLVEAFGQPEFMAQILMESVSESEQIKFQNRSKLIQNLRAALVLLFILFSLYAFFDKEYSAVTFYDSVTAETSANITQEGK